MLKINDVSVEPKSSSLSRLSSLKIRMTLFMLGIFLFSIWALTFYTHQILQNELSVTLGTQQFTSVSILAEQVNQNLESRFWTLKVIAKEFAPYLLKDASSLQAKLEEHPGILNFFNGGLYIVGLDGVIIADVPISTGRIGRNHLKNSRTNFIFNILNGNPTINRPLMGKTTPAPVIPMGVPILGNNDKVIGALVGVTNLAKSNFLDTIVNNHYGKTGDYNLVAPKYRLIITSSDKTRILEELPPAGANPILDKFIGGYEGYKVAQHINGAEVLVSVKKIPVADWYLAAILPTEEAFKSITKLQDHTILAAIIFTLLVGGLTWLMLNRQLAPIFSTLHTLANLSDTTQLLPITRKDEIGDLITGFNRLLITLREREEKLNLAASVFTHASEGIMITDTSGSIIEVNDTFCTITGYNREEVVGKNPRFLQSGRQTADFYTSMWTSLLETKHWHGEIWNRRKTGEVFAELATISAICDANGKAHSYVALFTDITAMKDHQQQLEYIAHYDVLTNLPNRVLLSDRLQQFMQQCERRKLSLAVVYLDLDGFKAINDTHGHQMGDELLITLSLRMKEALRNGDTIARIGGDEFVAVLVDIEKMTDCEPVLVRLLQASAYPVTVKNTILQVSASIGVTLYPQDGVDADLLMRHADQAMYIAKQAGKNRYHLFDTHHDAMIRTQRESLDAILHALDHHEFELYYQPKVNMRTGDIIGVEALIRWQHPELGLLLPNKFLPVIENHPISVKLGEWVIDNALTQIAEWQSIGLDIPVSVNVGARQLQQPDFATRLSSVFSSHQDVQPGSLELEILETSALEDIMDVSATLNACREIGVSFSLDDFGTGYSSLTYLKRLPVDLLKIDQSFVRGMLDDPDDCAIVWGVIGLAASFNRQVIAEGVETVAHGSQLLLLGCELAQGYGIARPMPAAEIPVWVASWKPDASWRI